jgi:hypothetical protein
MMSDISASQMFCGEEIISNFVDYTKYDDKSRLYIMNNGQRSNHSTVSCELSGLASGPPLSYSTTTLYQT